MSLVIEDFINDCFVLVDISSSIFSRILLLGSPSITNWLTIGYSSTVISSIPLVSFTSTFSKKFVEYRFLSISFILLESMLSFSLKPPYTFIVSLLTLLFPFIITSLITAALSLKVNAIIKINFIANFLIHS